MSDVREHGDVDVATLRAHGHDPEAVVDFSVNVSPFGPHPDVIAAARHADLSRYPERDARSAREALGAHLDVAPTCVALGNGAAELLFTIAHAFVEPGDTCLIVAPTFGEARFAFSAARGRVVEHHVSLDEEDDLDGLVTSIAAALTRHAPRVVYVCDPNNPTGRLLGVARLARLCLRFPSCLFVLDQAFLSLSTGHATARDRMPDNALVLRSMTKDHALAGLRLAYVVAHEGHIARIERARPPWTTNAMAQAAVPVALAHGAHVEAARTSLLALREGLASNLRTLDLRPHPSETIFLIVRVGDAERTRATLLASHGVLVRSCASFGMPAHIRLCARPIPDQARLVRALAATLENTDRGMKP